MPDPIESRPYNAYRADVDPKPLEQVSKQFKDWYFGSAVNSNLISQRPRKHEDEKKLRKQNSQGLFVHDVSIVSARNDDQALMVFPAPCLALIAGGVVAQLL